MHQATPLLVSSLSWLSNTVFVNAKDNVDSTHLDANTLTASYDCSHRGKEWHICIQPDGWGAAFYCPAYSEFNETELKKVEWGSLGVPTPFSPCFTCPGVDSNCSTVVSEVLTANNIAQDQNSTLGEWGIWDEVQEYCEVLCELNKEGESCNQDQENQCTPGALYCDYAADDKEYTDGTCKPCPTNPNECYEEGFAATVKGRQNCRDCRLYCQGVGASTLWIDGEVILSHPVGYAIQSSHRSASGPLHDCSKMILDPESICPGAEGQMCLIEYKEQFALPWQVADQAEKSGCAGVIAFVEGYDHPVSLADSELLIPYVYISTKEGKNLLDTKIGVTAEVEVDIFGSACYPNWESDMCSASWPCDRGGFCAFNSVPTGQGDEYAEGYCTPCPENTEGKPDPVACYFDNRRDGIVDTVETVSTKTIQRVKSCAASCGAELTSEGCKLCTSRVTGFEFGVDEEGDKCILCPQYDVQYPNRVVPLFGENVTCWQLESFFQRLPVPKDSRNCQLAQSMNFICGCEGTGYAGASTQRKQAVLAWMPRIAAIFSMLGSLFIIVDTQRTHKKRLKLINKILCTLSVFDFIGSFAMAFTTLPTPETDYIYGGKGNEATCTAQGFFIQMGTIACFCGVSLSVYYNLTIIQGWSDLKMRRKRALYFLLVPPILTGLIYAGVGIPYYGNVIIWCNNSARWWPEAPVIFAILTVTAIMGDVVYGVYKRERASSSYTGGGFKFSRMVFKQAVWFVGAFYMTWVPYLTLQYMWAAGTGYDVYGLTLAAATMVPLQGFWNFYVYARPRYFKGKRLSLPSVRDLSLLRSRIGAMFGSGIRSILRFAARRSTNRDRIRTNRTTLAQLSPKTSAIANNSPVESEPEVFHADEPHEPGVVPFGAPNRKDEPGVVPVMASDPCHAPDPDEDNEDAMYEMLLAG